MRCLRCIRNYNYVVPRLEGYSVKSYRHVVVLVFIVALLVAGWLSKRLDPSTVFCPLCWQESLWMAWRWVNDNLLLRPRETIWQVSCVSNLRQISVAILEHYVPEHGGLLPDQESWRQWIENYLKNRQVLYCPDAEPSQRLSYHLNPKLSGRCLKKLGMLGKTVLFYEGDEGGYPIARHHFKELFRHCCHVVFADGRIGHLTAAQVERLLQRQPVFR